MFENYTPHPVDTSGVDVSSSYHRELIERMAWRAHAGWMRDRRDENPGLTDDEIRKKYPMFREWNDLTEAERASARGSSEEAVKVLEMKVGCRNVALGYVSRDAVVDAVAENAHEVWARQRMDAGWAWGEKRDNEAKLHPMLKPYSFLPESEKEYDKAYGRLAYDCINEMKREREEQRTFEEDVVRGIWREEPGSAEAKALERFSREMEGTWEGDQLDIVNRALRMYFASEDVSSLQEYKGELLSTLGAEVASDRVNIGKPGFPADEAERRELSRMVADQMRTSFGRDEQQLLGRDGIRMMRDAYVSMLREKGESLSRIASLSPKEGKKMERQERKRTLLQRFEMAAKPEKGQKIK